MANSKEAAVIINGTKLNNLADKLIFVSKVLLRNGFNPITLPFYVTQVMLESAWLTSRIAKVDTNLTGIKIATAKSNIAFQNSLGVTRGSKAGYSEGNFHANYPNIDAWAKDYKRILSMGVKPILATDPNAFINALYKNNFFTAAGMVAYQKGFNATLATIKTALKNLPLPNNKNNGTLPIIIIIAVLFGILIY